MCVCVDCVWPRSLCPLCFVGGGFPVVSGCFHCLGDEEGPGVQVSRCRGVPAEEAGGGLSGLLPISTGITVTKWAADV